jgi:hypothetical protein
MNPQVETALLSALVPGPITLCGWFISNWLTKRREDEARRQQPALKHLEQQMEELYGPLLGLIEQSGAVFSVATQRRRLAARGGTSAFKRQPERKIPPDSFGLFQKPATLPMFSGATVVAARVLGHL